MHIQLHRDSGVPLARQIAQSIRQAVTSGRLPDGARLPAERTLATSLGVDRMTVARAYEELAREGLIERHVGRGSFVSQQRGAARRDAPPGPATSAWSAAFASRSPEPLPAPPGMLQQPTRGSVVNLSSLFPDPDLFPLKDFTRAMDDVLQREGGRLLGYGSAGGYAPLREFLAGTMRRGGVETGPEEILITNGSQQGIDLVARTFLDPGDRVVLENPTYTGAVQVFQSHRAQISGVALDSEGMVPDDLESLLSRSDARLIYLIPNFQNPTSGTMGLARRRAILDVALRHGVPILEDDFGGDLRYEGSGQPSMKALDPRGQIVIYLSTFAKKLVPGLRIGWLAGPPEVVRRLVAIKRITDWSTSLLLQGALHEFCARGHLDTHLERVVTVYRERRDVMLRAMKRHFPEEIRWTRPEGGLFIWVTLPPGVDAEEVVIEARSRGILVSSGDLFFLGPGSRSNLRLVFGQAGPEAIRRSVRILGQILTRMVDTSRRAAVPGQAESLPVL